MRLSRLVGTAFGIGAATLGYALCEAHWFQLRQTTVPLLKAGSAPLKLLHISDLHLTAHQTRKVAWVRNLARLEPDLVVVTGDNFAFGDAMESAIEAFEPLFRFPGAFVFGSNDYYSAVFKNPITYLWRSSRLDPERQPDLPTTVFRDVLINAGWHFLDNARASLQLGPQQLNTRLVGLGDPHLGWDTMPPMSPEPLEHSAELVLGVVHAPYQAAVQNLVDDSAQLVLAGHTHGGQVTLPFWGALVSNTDLPRRLAAGLHQWPGSQAYLHVSAGLGTSPYAPIRLARRPEATLLTLCPKTE
ncbi:MAG: metallophosphoesterase family protein [Bifidobacteriaceae bacterium]|nr:metallophosphoesterase family protein [Bifidobacteriaceae bacterium]